MTDRLFKLIGIKKAKELLNWEPSITLEEGIKELKI
jgi:nucleoside-diphosphate-sugar epimerase